MSATPWRLSPKEYLGAFYSKTVVTLQPPELIKLGRAVPARIFGFEDFFDLDEISLDQSGDFSGQDMARQGVELRNLAIVYQEWLKITPNHSTIAFCSTVSHAEALSKYFNDQGVPSACITGDTSETERQHLFAQLKDGSLKMLASINTLTAGFDSPNVTCVLYVRLTKSKALYHQATGRGARVYPGKDFFYILDFGSNYRRLGNPMSFQDYDISEKKTKERSRTKICPSCGESISVFARVCPCCGHEFSPVDEETDEDDSQLDSDAEMVEYFCQQDRRRLSWFRRAKKQAYTSGVHPDSASFEFKQRYGFLPPRDWHLGSVLGQNPTPQVIAEFQAYLQQYAPHDFWLKSQMQLELGDGQKRKNKKQSKSRSNGTDRENRQKQKTESREPFKYTATVAPWHIVLGVRLGATTEEVKRAYRRLAAKWHPDLCQDQESFSVFEGRMKEINNAYDTFKELGRNAS